MNIYCFGFWVWIWLVVLIFGLICKYNMGMITSDFFETKIQSVCISFFTFPIFYQLLDFQLFSFYKYLKYDPNKSSCRIYNQLFLLLAQAQWVLILCILHKYVLWCQIVVITHGMKFLVLLAGLIAIMLILERFSCAFVRILTLCLRQGPFHWSTFVY